MPSKFRFLAFFLGGGLLIIYGLTELLKNSLKVDTCMSLELALTPSVFSLGEKKGAITNDVTISKTAKDR